MAQRCSAALVQWHGGLARLGSMGPTQWRSLFYFFLLTLITAICAYMYTRRNLEKALPPSIAARLRVPVCHPLASPSNQALDASYMVSFGSQAHSLTLSARAEGHPDIVSHIKDSLVATLEALARCTQVGKDMDIQLQNSL